ncbi:hypothetical protein [Longimicrobium sp.]|uniref:hypothetical protein n=1 Tax=Longimicrobium sp. TaxID=2029185 RepID=UPI002ED93BA9
MKQIMHRSMAVRSSLVSCTKEHIENLRRILQFISRAQLVGNLPRQSTDSLLDLRSRLLAMHFCDCHPEIRAVKVEKLHVDLEARALDLFSPCGSAFYN